MELVVVEQRLEHAITPARLHSALDRHAWCRRLYRVRHVRSLIAKDGHRMICIFEAPDAEAVRAIADRMGFSYERIWSAVLVRDDRAEVGSDRSGPS